MDRPVIEPRTFVLFKPFEWPDLIPYTIAVTMLIGCLYISLHVTLFSKM
ncbi:hypothetical protein LLH06_06415 [Mucilaginibacter daejeonensis]|nr:hypothetical protein [Mucilaginibacter daejeonensis]UEG54593.1 hypothetical protein LLH06_06415 [Mucilaginibacter daejeonensis]